MLKPPCLLVTALATNMPSMSLASASGTLLTIAFGHGQIVLRVNVDVNGFLSLGYIPGVVGDTDATLWGYVFVNTLVDSKRCLIFGM